MFLRSGLLERDGHTVAAFTTRAGGVSEGALASLNLARRPGEEEARLQENWDRVRAALGRPGAPVAVANQVHGDLVLRGDTGVSPLSPVGDADALLVLEPGRLAAVRVADCVPILLWAPGGVAAVHAGWRGTALGIATRAVEALCAATGADPAALRAAIGPCIGPCCYEVGDDVAHAVGVAAGGAEVVDRSRGRPRVDLRAANEAILRAAGVVEVERVAPCTACSPDFFSHRGDGADTGRQVGIIGLLP